MWEQSDSEEEGQHRRQRRVETQNRETGNSKGTKAEKHKPQHPESGGNSYLYMRGDAKNDLQTEALGTAACAETAVSAGGVKGPDNTEPKADKVAEELRRTASTKPRISNTVKKRA